MHARNRLLKNQATWHNFKAVSNPPHLSNSGSQYELLYVYVALHSDFRYLSSLST